MDCAPWPAVTCGGRGAAELPTGLLTLRQAGAEGKPLGRPAGTGRCWPRETPPSPAAAAMERGETQERVWLPTVKMAAGGALPAAGRFPPPEAGGKGGPARPPLAKMAAGGVRVFQARVATVTRFTSG